MHLCVESNKYENALNYLQQATQLTLNENNKSVYSFNWSQVCILNNENVNVNKILNSIKIGCNKCLFWEQSLKI